jgi:hypothetical protein
VPKTKRKTATARLVWVRRGTTQTQLAALLEDHRAFFGQVVVRRYRAPRKDRPGEWLPEAPTDADNILGDCTHKDLIADALQCADARLLAALGKKGAK